MSGVRMRHAAFMLLSALLILPSVAACAERPAVEPPKRGAEADSVPGQVAAMSLAEKLGQLVLVGVEGQTLDEAARDLISARHVGGVILYQDNIGSVSQTAAFLNELKAANGGNKAPLWLSVDQEGGRVSRMPASYVQLPPSAVVGESGDPDVAQEVGAVLGAQVASLGFNMNFAPVLDINSTPGNPVIGDRSFGRDPDQVSTLGVAAMRGVQSQHVVSVVKHFPGHGDTTVDSHLDLPVVSKSLESLQALELRPFRRAIGQGADAIMVAHLLLPHLDEQNPASCSRRVITNLLRDQLGYDGVVITDDLTMGAITGHRDLGETAVRAVQAGVDIVMVAHGYARADAVLTALQQAVTSGVLSAQTVDRSVARILALKQKYHLSDKPTPVPDLRALNERAARVLRGHLRSE